MTNHAPQLSALIHELFVQFAQVSGRMPYQPLHTLERRELGGIIQPHSLALVVAVARAMQGHPERFPHARVSGAELSERQRCAIRWLKLRDLLQQLATQANDHYLRTQSQAMLDATAVVRDAIEAPRHDPLRTPRLLCLVVAFDVIDEYQRSCEKKKKAAQKAKNPPDAQRVTKAKPSRPSGARFQLIARRFMEDILEAFEVVCAHKVPAPACASHTAAAPDPAIGAGAVEVVCPLW